MPSETNITRLIECSCLLGGRIISVGDVMGAAGDLSLLKVTLRDVEVWRGDPPVDGAIIMAVDKKPGLGSGQYALLGGNLTSLHTTDSTPVYTVYIICQSMADIRELAATINKGVPGWVTKNDRFISPFKAPFPGLHSGPRCAVTGRPVLRLSSNIVFGATRVIPPTVLEARNPLGDGIFSLQVRNEGAVQETIPLLVSGSTLLWDQSVVCINRGSSYIFRESVPKDVQFHVLGPGESVTGNINTLHLMDFPWPQMDERIYFTFALGTLCASSFFDFSPCYHKGMIKSTLKHSDLSCCFSSL